MPTAKKPAVAKKKVISSAAKKTASSAPNKPAVKKVVAKKPAVKKSVAKAPAKKKGLLSRLLRSQKGLVQTRGLSKAQFLLTAAVLGTIGIIGVVATHGSSSGKLQASYYYGCTSSATIQSGSSGACVVYLQNQLNVYKKSLGLVFPDGKNAEGTVVKNADLTPDGKFGLGTKAAVIAFQKEKKLTPYDGIVGPATWGAIGMPTMKPAAKVTPVPTPVKKVAAGSTVKPTTKPAAAVAATPKPTAKPVTSTAWHISSVKWVADKYGDIYAPMLCVTYAGTKPGTARDKISLFYTDTTERSGALDFDTLVTSPNAPDNCADFAQAINFYREHRQLYGAVDDVNLQKYASGVQRIKTQTVSIPSYDSYVKPQFKLTYTSKGDDDGRPYYVLTYDDPDSLYLTKQSRLMTVKVNGVAQSVVSRGNGRDVVDLGRTMYIVKVKTTSGALRNPEPGDVVQLGNTYQVKAVGLNGTVTTVISSNGVTLPGAPAKAAAPKATPTPTPKPVVADKLTVNTGGTGKNGIGNVCLKLKFNDTQKVDSHKLYLGKSAAGRYAFSTADGTTCMADATGDLLNPGNTIYVESIKAGKIAASDTVSVPSNFPTFKISGRGWTKDNGVEKYCVDLHDANTQRKSVIVNGTVWYTSSNNPVCPSDHNGSLIKKGDTIRVCDAANSSNRCSNDFKISQAKPAAPAHKVTLTKAGWDTNGSGNPCYRVNIKDSGSWGSHIVYIQHGSTRSRAFVNKATTTCPADYSNGSQKVGAGMKIIVESYSGTDGNGTKLSTSNNITIPAAPKPTPAGIKARGGTLLQ